MARPLPAGMPALTLWQPWASLVALDIKTIETRSWRAPEKLIGERIAIHAAKRKPRTVFESANGGGLPDWFPADASDSSWLYGLGEETADGHWLAHQWTGPLGAIVATATLTDCVPMVRCVERDDPWVSAHLCLGPPGDYLELWCDGELYDLDVTDQLPYGDFAPGRWAWLLDEVTPTTVLCPWCGGFVADCLVCDGAGSCDPVPAKGRQRLWRWSP